LPECCLRLSFAFAHTSLIFFFVQMLNAAILAAGITNVCLRRLWALWPTSNGHGHHELSYHLACMRGSGGRTSPLTLLICCMSLQEQQVLWHLYATVNARTQLTSIGREVPAVCAASAITKVVSLQHQDI
jgi:hypothetical protein